MTASMDNHPSDAELLAWLDDSALVEEESPTTEHVNLCERCAAVIERLAEEHPEPAVSDDRMRQALTDAVAPPADLAERLRARLREREQTKEELNTVLRLFGLPTATMQAMSTSQQRVRRDPDSTERRVRRDPDSTERRVRRDPGSTGQRDRRHPGDRP